MSPLFFIIAGGFVFFIVYALLLFGGLLGGPTIEDDPVEEIHHDVLRCPGCGQQHIDRGEWATRPHHRHRCDFCQREWRVVPYTFGVERPSLRAVEGGRRG